MSGAELFRLMDKYNRLVAEMNRSPKSTRSEIWKRIAALGRRITIERRGA